MTRADAALLLVLMFGIGLLFRQFWTPPAPAGSVRVQSPAGSETLQLTGDREWQVHGPLGASTLRIEDGRVRFIASPCRHQICVRSGWHARSGAVAACVPNRISLLLLGGEGKLDALSY